MSFYGETYRKLMYKPEDQSIGTNAHVLGNDIFKNW